VREALSTLLRNPVKALFIGAIRAYQVVISPGLPGRCKYYPSCSQYGLDAIKEYGAARGCVLAVWRVLRCNPLSYGGYDPVSRQKLFATRSGATPPTTSPVTPCPHVHDAGGPSVAGGRCAAGGGVAPGPRGLRG
jgi:putative membrane protein insertion efficiency factor